MSTINAPMVHSNQEIKVQALASARELHTHHLRVVVQAMNAGRLKH